MDTAIETAEVRLGILRERPATTPDLPVSAEGLQEFRFIQFLSVKPAWISGIDHAELALMDEEVLHRAVAVSHDSVAREIVVQLELSPDGADVLNVVLPSTLASSV